MINLLQGGCYAANSLATTLTLDSCSKRSALRALEPRDAVLEGDGAGDEGCNLENFFLTFMTTSPVTRSSFFTTTSRHSHFWGYRSKGFRPLLSHDLRQQLVLHLLHV